MFILFNIVYLKKSTYGFISDIKFFFKEKNVTQAIHNNKTLLKFSSMLIFKLRMLHQSIEQRYLRLVYTEAL